MKIDVWFWILYLPLYVFELIDIVCTICSYDLELWHPIVLNHKHLSHNELPDGATIE